MATIPENPTPIINAPIFIPEYWIHTPPITTTNITDITKTTLLGQIVMVARTTLPSPDYVWCDGTSYPTTFYPSLFALIGYNYGGSGDNFNVPNLINKTFVGADLTTSLTTTYGGSPVSTGGNKNIDGNQLATHSHSITISPLNMAVNVGFNQTSNGVGPYIFNPLAPINVNGSSLGVNGSMGNAGSGADYLPPFFVCNYMIRAI
jgi:microcystin-dependent protein